MSLSKEQRDDLVRQIEERKMEYNAPSNRHRFSVEQNRATLAGIEALRSHYDNSLPAITLARCPICKEPLVARMDIYGINGPFWNHTGGSPVIGRCEHFLSFLGALNYRGHVPSIEECGFYNEIHSGPEIPYIVPRLMEIEGMNAVISSLPIEDGKYQAFLTSYFSDPPAPPSQGHQVWLRRAFYYRVEDGTIGDSRNDVWDFDLQTWLTRKPAVVRWLQPGDPALGLQEGAENCPYIGLKGRRESIVCRRGRMRVEPAPDGSALDLFD